MLLFGSTALYLSFRPDINFLLAKPDLVHNVPWRTAFYIHIVGGMSALATGPFQFLKGFRAKNKRFHRNLGKVYLAAILFVAGPSGLYMAMFANGGTLAQVGFTILSFIWVAFTWQAYAKARQKDFLSHKKWMIRSFALTFAAVTLRLWVPLCSLVFGMDHDITVIGTAWLSWLPNLVIAELLIRKYLNKF